MSVGGTTEGALAVAAPWRRTRRRRGTAARLTVVGCAVVVAVVVGCGLFGPSLLSDAATAQDLARGATGPSAEHLLGTDQLGRDVLARMVLGCRNALVAPVLIALGTVIIGGALGMLAGYAGGTWDSVISRGADLVYAMPGLLIVIVVLGALEGSYALAIALFVLLALPTEIRLCRSATLGQRQLPYVDAARTLGLSRRRILARHVLPNIMPVIVAPALLDFVGALVGFASLSFFGLGVSPGSAEWGLMLADGRAVIYQNAWASMAPGLAIVVLAASVTLLGDWVYDRLSGGGASFSQVTS